MFQIISAGIGLGTSVDKTATAKYLQSEEYKQDALNYSRSKNLMIYTGANTQAALLVLVLVALAGTAIYLLVKK